MNSQAPKFTLGSDPEMFISRNGEIISVPDIIDDEYYDEETFQFFADNALLEFNSEPAATKEDFVEHNDSAMEYLRDFFAKKGLEINTAIDNTFDPSTLTHFLCQEFGCQPDMNAYSKKENPKPNIDKVGSYRVAGGHIHIGYENENEDTSLLLIKNLDATLGCFGVLVEGDNNRRIQYGQAGSYRRSPDIKVEYRSPSNFWIHSTELMEIVYDLVEYAVIMTIDKGINLEDPRIQNAINSRDLEVCEEILTNSLTNKKLLKKCVAMRHLTLRSTSLVTVR